MPNSPALKKTRHISLVLRISVAVAALFWVFRDQDWAQLGKTFAKMNLWFLAGSLGIYIVSQAIVGLRWWTLLRAQSIFIGYWAAVRLHFLGLFYNNFMPSTLGGDLIRAWYVTRHTEKKLEAALSVFVDRTIGLFGVVIIAVFCYLLFIRGQGVITSGKQGSFLASFSRYRWGFLWLIAVASAVFFVFLLLKPGRSMLRKSWSYICVHGVRVIKKSTDAIIIYCSKPLSILVALLLTILVQTMVITAFWLLGVNLEIDASARYYFVFFPITWVLGALPVTIAGIGIVEGGLRELFTRFAGVGVEEVLALALCYRAVFTFASLPGAVIHLFGAHLPKDLIVSEIDCDDCGK